MSESSYRTILRSSSIIGGAQVITISASLLKMKAAAVLLGPAGVGLVGLYMNLMQTASTVASLGVGNSGTRQIAAAHAQGDAMALGRTRRALFWGTAALALLGAALVWLCRGLMAEHVLGDTRLAGDVGWLALGVALTVAAGAQSALLTGTRHVGDLARISVGVGLLGTLLGVGAMWLWGSHAVIAMVLAGPALGLMLGHFYVARLGPPAGESAPLPAMAKEWSGMVRLGVAFMLSGLVTLIGQLLVRAMVQRELGAEASGQFQAAWAIGMTYLGFVLGAMGTDFYPRLTAVINDKEAATRLVNEQTEVALLLCAPVLLLMLGLAPWVIQLLYAAEFEPAVEVLRWQLLGDVLKVISWPLGFVILAAGAGKTFLLTETLAIGVFVAGVWLGLTWLGVKATGVAFLAMYVAYLPIVWWLAKRRIGFSWTPAVRKQALVMIAAALCVELAARWADWAGAGVGVLLAVLLGVWALIRLSSMAGLGGKLGWITRAGQRLRACVGVRV